MGLLIRGVIVLVVCLGAMMFVPDEQPTGKIISILVWLGTISLAFGPVATEGGFFAKGHYISHGTPGCVWTFLGVICWLIAIVLFVSAS